MAQEIERKFLVKLPEDIKGGEFIEQGYIIALKFIELRVRYKSKKYTMTLKIGQGITRKEYEWKINNNLGKLIMPKYRQIRKYRFEKIYDGMTWELDSYTDKNNRLSIGEVELIHPDQKIRIPNWVISEVTGIKEYSNAYLARKNAETK